MTYDPSKGAPRVIPSLVYADADAALDWLQRVFGFREVLRWVDDEGTLRHVDLELEGGYVMFDRGEPGYRSPAQRGEDPDHSVILYVSDVDAHFERAAAAGATILTEPHDRPWGLRQYKVLDLDGLVWEFSEFQTDVPPEDWGAVPAPR